MTGVLLSAGHGTEYSAGFFAAKTIQRLFEHLPRERGHDHRYGSEHDQTHRRNRQQPLHRHRQPPLKKHRNEYVIYIEAVADSSGKDEAGKREETTDNAMKSGGRSRNQKHKSTGFKWFHHYRF